MKLRGKDLPLVQARKAGAHSQRSPRSGDGTSAALGRAGGLSPLTETPASVPVHTSTACSPGSQSRSQRSIFSMLPPASTSGTPTLRQRGHPSTVTNHGHPGTKSYSKNCQTEPTARLHQHYEHLLPTATPRGAANSVFRAQLSASFARTAAQGGDRPLEIRFIGDFHTLTWGKR